MQKRKCRLSKYEMECHDRAVKLRKMTDEQLCRHIDDNVGKAYQEGLSKGAFEYSQNTAEKSVEHFLDFLDIPGVGKSTVDKLMKYAKERGYIGVG